MPKKDLKNQAKVTVKLLGIFKKAHGEGQTQLEIQGKDNLGTVVEEMCEVSLNLKRVLIDPERGTPLPNSVILVNGIEIGLLKGLKTELKDGDEVVFIPVIHGG